MDTRANTLLAIAITCLAVWIIAPDANAKDGYIQRAPHISIDIGHRIPPHVSIGPLHVEYEHRHHLKPYFDKAIRNYERARHRVEGAISRRVHNYLDEAQHHIRRAERLYRRSPHRHERTVLQHLRHARENSRSAIRASQQYTQDVGRAIREAAHELRDQRHHRYFDPHDHGHGYFPDRHVGDERQIHRVERKLRRARRELSRGHTVRAHRILDEVVRDIRYLR